MSTEALVQTLIDLDLDPNVVDVIGRQIREEGLTTDVRARIVSLLREASAISRKTDEELLSMLETIVTAESNQERIKAQTKLRLKEIEDETEREVIHVIAQARQEESKPAEPSLTANLATPAPAWD